MIRKLLDMHIKNHVKGKLVLIKQNM